MRRLGYVPAMRDNAERWETFVLSDPPLLKLEEATTRISDEFRVDQYGSAREMLEAFLDKPMGILKAYTYRGLNEVYWPRILKALLDMTPKEFEEAPNLSLFSEWNYKVDWKLFFRFLWEKDIMPKDTDDDMDHPKWTKLFGYCFTQWKIPMKEDAQEMDEIDLDERLKMTPMGYNRASAMNAAIVDLKQKERGMELKGLKGLRKGKGSVGPTCLDKGSH